MDLQKFVEALTPEEINELKSILNEETSKESRLGLGDGPDTDMGKFPPIGGGFPGDPFPQPEPEE